MCLVRFSSFVGNIRSWRRLIQRLLPISGERFLWTAIHRFLGLLVMAHVLVAFSSSGKMSSRKNLELALRDVLQAFCRRTAQNSGCPELPQNSRRQEPREACKCWWGRPLGLPSSPREEWAHTVRSRWVSYHCRGMVCTPPFFKGFFTHGSSAQLSPRC